MFSTSPKSHRSDGGLGYRKDFSRILKSLCLRMRFAGYDACCFCFFFLVSGAAVCGSGDCKFASLKPKELSSHRLLLTCLLEHSLHKMHAVYLWCCICYRSVDVSTAFAARRYHFVLLNGVGVGKSTHHIGLPLVGGFQFITNVCSSP